MSRFIRFGLVARAVLLTTMVVMTGSCSDVAFRSNPNDEGGGKEGCSGASCPPGTSGYSWYQGAFGMCSKPCGGGEQTTTVECRRNSDNVAVADSFCTGTRPPAVRACNLNSCNGSYDWNIGDYGQCSKTCGGGAKTRNVVCQDRNGGTVSDSNCPQPKPVTSDVCGTDACVGTTSYKWDVTAGVCSKQCGGGTATDTVVCKSSDGSIVADSFCASTTKPPTTRTCGTDQCPTGGYTYAWDPQAWTACSKNCGDGTKTRAVPCKRSPDGVYVDGAYCAGTTKPVEQMACHDKDCPAGGTPVVQTATVTPAQNLLDVVLIVDDSSSMANDQAKLASRLIQFVSDLDSLNIDYQICLTTTDIRDNGGYKGRPIKWTSGSHILNKATGNKNQVFIDTVNSLGAQWSSDEQGIKATYMMIRDFGPKSGANNSGCFRDKATLTVIEISDEDERSVGGNQSLSPAQYQPLTAENMPDTLISFVHSTFDSAGFTKPFIWNSIIVRPGDNACEAKEDAEGSPSFPGVLLASLATKTNGQIASICDDDYARNMSLIKDRVVNSMPGIQLQCVPLDNPQITFNPAFTTNVTRTGDQLKFNPALPENTQVTLRYTCP